MMTATFMLNLSVILGQHIRLWGAESWGNVNQLRDRYVDVFGLKDEDYQQYMVGIS